MTKCENINCNKDSSLRCSKCKNKNYCSKECQKNDWEIHKTTCKTSHPCATKECQKNDRKTHTKTATEPIEDSKTHKSSSNVQTRPVINKCTNVNCNKDCSLRCSKCKNKNYCSKECQNNDWKTHKTTCKTSHPCATSSKIKPTCKSSQPRSAARSQNDAPGMPEAYQDFLYSMMGMMSSKTMSVADEYRRAFPLEADHLQRIKKEELVYRSAIMNGKHNLPLFCDEDFNSSMNFAKRWGACIRYDKDDLCKFLTKERLKAGDIYIRKHYEPYQSQFFQTMRNTAITSQVYEFGKTYVGFGYVDLFQLIWGAFQKVDVGNLTFYGYEMCHVTYLRSKLIYHMFKIDDVSTNSILQVWFSSCWDTTTLKDFEKCVDDLLTHSVENTLSKEDLAVLVIWKDFKITPSLAKQKFSEGLENPDFDDIWRMIEVKDRVKFSRYLFTGCIFVDEAQTVCGNSTMFTVLDGQEKMTGELFFKAIGLKETEGQKDTFSDNLFELIEYLTREKTEKFRSLIKAGKILCHLNRSFIDPKDLEFASSVRSLRPYAIDWSNIADYMEKSSFIKFARACSVDNTIHQMHFLNWTYYVFGSVHVDWYECQTKLQDMFKMWRREKENVKCMLQEMGHGTSFYDRYFRGEFYTNTLNSVNLMLACIFRSRFEDFFLSDENGKPLNRYKSNVCYAAILPFFSQSPTMFCSTFSFDEDIDLVIGDA